MTKKQARTILILVILAICLAIWYRFLSPLWQHKRMVLSVGIPNSTDTVELWEELVTRFIVSEYETWFVIRSATGKQDWHVIDPEYIQFLKVAVLMSSDSSRIRVETTGISSPSTMIAEYDLRNQMFRAESESSVIGKEGWVLLKEKNVRCFLDF